MTPQKKDRLAVSRNHTILRNWQPFGKCSLIKIKKSIHIFIVKYTIIIYNNGYII